ncbi:MAG: DUF2807 domain-containing protein [Chlamydiia bacterium]|nr:DUF2807 domain-containing protein [Chlamydiia bacterium]
MNLITLKNIFFLLLAISFSSCNVNTIVGSGRVITESRPITEFSDIYVQGDYILHIKQGNSYKLFLKMDDNLLDNTSTEIEGDELQIISNSNVLNSSAKDIYITVKKLDRIKLVGSVDLTNSNIFTVNSLTIISEGVCNLDLHVLSNIVSLNLSGSSKVKLIGVSDYLDVEMAGYGTLNSLGLFCDNVTLELSGAVSSKVFSKNYLDVVINGAGRVYYKGTPELIVESSRNGMVLPLKNISK